MDVHRQLSSFLKDFCAARQIDEVLPIESLSFATKKGAKQPADYRIFVGKPAHRVLRPQLKLLTDKLLEVSASWPVPVAKCHFETSSPYFEVYLHRAAAFQSLFGSIFVEDTRNTQQAFKQKVLIFVPFLDESFSAVRTEKLAAYACACYLEKDVDVALYTSRPALVTSQSEGVNLIPCIAESEIGTAPDFLSVVECCKYYNRDTSTFSLRCYLNERGIDVSSNYDANVDSVHVESSAFATMRLLARIVRDCMSEPPTLLFVVPDSKSFVAQQAGLLYEMLFVRQSPGGDVAPKVLYLTHGGCVEPIDCSFETYQSGRGNYIREAFRRPSTEPSLPKRSRTAEDVFLEGEGSTKEDVKSSVAALVETELAFEFLSSRQNLRMKMGERLSCAENGHYSLQYTAARIAAVLDKYEHAVNEGAYPALCNLEEADFSLLMLQPEWMLWHRLLICWRLLLEPSPATLHGNPIKVEVNAHALCKALEGLSSEFSAYYSKVRILVQPEQHLLKTLCTRLWLLKAIQKTLQRIFRRFGLTTLNKM